MPGRRFLLCSHAMWDGMLLDAANTEVVESLSVGRRHGGAASVVWTKNPVVLLVFVIGIGHFLMEICYEKDLSSPACQVSFQDMFIFKLDQRSNQKTG